MARPMILILSVLGLSMANNFNVTLSPYDWEAGGSYRATGTFFGKSVWPTTSAGVSGLADFAIDVPHHQYKLTINQQHQQWGFDNGTYFVDAGQCSFVPVNYAGWLDVYKTGAVHSGKFSQPGVGVVNIYSGLVRDPGTCTTFASVTMVQDKKGRLVGYNFAQAINLAPNIPNAPVPFIPGHVVATMQFNRWYKGVPSESHFQLPESCYSAGTPASFCSKWYPTPPGLFVTPK